MASTSIMVFSSDPAPDAWPHDRAAAWSRRTLTVSGVPETYAMMGWRVDYAAGPAALNPLRLAMRFPVAAADRRVIDRPGRARDRQPSPGAQDLLGRAHSSRAARASVTVFPRYMNDCAPTCRASRRKARVSSNGCGELRQCGSASVHPDSRVIFDQPRFCRLSA